MRMRMRMRNRKWIGITDAALTASDLHGAAAGCQPKDPGAHARPGSHSRTGPTQLNSAVPVLGPLETPAPPETVPIRLLATGGEEPCRNRRRLGDPTDVRPIQISFVRPPQLRGSMWYDAHDTVRSSDSSDACPNGRTGDDDACAARGRRSTCRPFYVLVPKQLSAAAHEHRALVWALPAIVATARPYISISIPPGGTVRLAPYAPAAASSRSPRRPRRAGGEDRRGCSTAIIIKYIVMGRRGGSECMLCTCYY